MSILTLMELHDRQKTILEALIQEYVKTAHPVSSKDLVKRRHVPFSSATIRNDFKALDAMGYLAQPHISAGRIPTDKAYRLYINEHNDGNTIKEKDVQALSHLSRARDKESEEFLHSAAVILSELSGGFTTAGVIDERIFFKYGFSEVMQEPEFSDQMRVQEFGRLIDGFEKGADELFSNIAPHIPEVFIGKENPIQGAEECGMIVYAYRKNSGKKKKKRIISILGPKRMDYQRNISLLKEFDEVVRGLYED